MKWWPDELMYLRRRAGGGPPAPSALGPLHFDVLNNGSGEWTQVGGGMTFNFPGLRINTTTGGHGQYAYLTATNQQVGWDLHCLEKWKMRAQFTCPTIAANSFGFSLGIKSFNGYSKISNYVRLSCDTGSPLGSFYFYNDLNGSVTQDVKGSFTLVGGTTYYFELERQRNALIARLLNSSGVVINSQQKVYDITAVNSVWPHNLGRFCVWAHGGTFTISQLYVESAAWRNADMLFVGPSHYVGLYGGNAQSLCDQAAAGFVGSKFEVLAGVDGGIDDMSLSQSLLLSPRCIVFDGGIRNNIAAGMATATWKSKLAAAVAALGVGGYDQSKLVLASSVASNIDVSAHKTELDSVYSSFVRADQYMASKGGGTALNAAYDSGDHIHMNFTGHSNVSVLVGGAIGLII